MALVNERLYERLVLLHIVGENYVVATPDQDVHLEELSLLNTDLRGIRRRIGPGLPVNIRVEQTYQLPDFTAAELAGFQVEAANVRRRGGKTSRPCGSAGSR